MSEPCRYRVSDAVTVPLRGYLLRLRLLEGRPDIRALRPGNRLLLRAPDGAQRAVTILDFSLTGGRATQKRLDATGEADILIPAMDAAQDGRWIEIGWIATPAATAQHEGAA